MTLKQIETPTFNVNTFNVNIKDEYIMNNPGAEFVEEISPKYLLFTLNRKRKLVLYVEISETIEKYKEILERQSFGPLPILQEDHKTTLLMLETMKIDNAEFYVKTLRTGLIEKICDLCNDPILLSHYKLKMRSTNN